MKLRSWLLNRHNAKSCRQKFVQKGFKKKELTLEEINKREWKKKKSMSKDKSPWRYGAGKHKKLACEKGHRSERREMKAALKEGNWESYTKTLFTTSDEKQWEAWYGHNDWDDFLERKRKNYIDPWDWY